VQHVVSFPIPLCTLPKHHCTILLGIIGLERNKQALHTRNHEKHYNSSKRIFEQMPVSKETVVTNVIVFYGEHVISPFLSGFAHFLKSILESLQ
jgi:hypothetical protein